MKKVYICSPYRGDTEQNERKAIGYCQKALEAGYMPVAPHLYFPRILDDADPAQRDMGIAMGLHLLAYCMEIWVFGPPSAGMRDEIERAEKLGVRVVLWDA